MAVFWAFLLLFGALVHFGSASSASLPSVVYKAWVTFVWLLLDTPFGRRSGGGHYLRDLWGEWMAAHKKRHVFSFLVSLKLCVFSCGRSRICQPQWDSTVSMVLMHVWFIGIKEHFGEIAGKSTVRPLFLLFLGFFCLVGIQGYGFGV